MKRFSICHAALHALLATIVLMLCITTSFAAEALPSGDSFYGSKPLADKLGNTDPFTDTTIITSSGTRTYQYDTRRLKSIFVSVVSDKNVTFVITPLPDYDTPATLGGVSSTCTVNVGDPGCKYEDIAAPRAKIVVTNAEASDMTSYTFTVRGSVY